MSIKAYSYLRFSTPEQAKGDSQRRQWELAQRYAEEHRLELDEELSFRDLGVSAFRGANADTGRLGDFLRAVDEGLVAESSFLLVESLDRISRSTARKAFGVLQSIIDKGVTVVTLADRRVYNAASLANDATSLLMSILVFMRAHEESATKSLRAKNVIGQKREKAREEGALFTRRLPAWICWSEENRSLELIEERAKVVRDIYEMAASGLGKDAITRRLNDRGEPTFGKAEFWHRSYVEKILKNPAAAGTFVPRVKEFNADGKAVRKAQEPIHNYFPAVVSEEVFSRQALRPKAAKGRHSGKAVTSIFQGLGSCDLCGSSFVRVSKGKGKNVYLVCSKAHAKGRCEYRSIPYCQAEDAITHDIDAIIDEIPRGQNTEELEREIEGLEIELFDEDTSLQFLIDDYAKTKSRAIGKRITELERQREAKAERLKALRAEREELASDLILKRIDRLRAAFATVPFDRGVANKALGEVVKTFRFSREGICAVWQTGGEAVQDIPLGNPFPKS